VKEQTAAQNTLIQFVQACKHTHTQSKANYEGLKYLNLPTGSLAILNQIHG